MLIGSRQTLSGALWIISERKPPGRMKHRRLLRSLPHRSSSSNSLMSFIISRILFSCFPASCSLSAYHKHRIVAGARRGSERWIIYCEKSKTIKLQAKCIAPFLTLLPSMPRGTDCGSSENFNCRLVLTNISRSPTCRKQKKKTKRKKWSKKLYFRTRREPVSCYT